MIRIAFEIRNGAVSLEVATTGGAQRSHVDVQRLLSAPKPDLAILNEYAWLLKRVLGLDPPPDTMVCVAMLGRTIGTLISLPQRSPTIHMHFECDG